MSGLTTIVTIVCLALALVVVVLTGVRALRDQPVAGPDLGAAALLELGLVVYLAARIADLVRGPQPHSVALAVLYLVGTMLVMPVTALLGIAEKSRWGPVVLGAGAIVVSVLFARIDQVWSPHG
ncbi:hypothetical protein [Jatrophihabitans endophyticus]|uniref:hypothetical protein n=1 Tax=Jatrophihabitans endophyticus TaxID=1206085 RepID=UPI0019E9DC16|nr:hypothetical protein [Jatrophihabitans endophyticus]MBE7189500.1 hypothetical protein [Jatrophihabitans endophyticus]